MEIKPFAYVSKQYWMISCLGLHGVELDVYSIIYGFSQDGSEHPLSIQYFIKWIGAADSTIRRSIASLLSKGLIRVRNVPGKFSFYACEIKPIDDALKSINGGEARSDDLTQLGEELRQFDPYGFNEEKRRRKGYERNRKTH